VNRFFTLFVLIQFMVSIALAASPARMEDAVVKNTISIGSNAVANSKSLLDLSSTTKGLLYPRMTTAQRTAIASPPEGLVVYDTDLDRIAYYTGGAWRTNATLDGTETFTGKTHTDPIISDAVRLSEQSSTPSTPASGYKKLYAKNDGKVYTLNSSGVESQVGAGSGGGTLNWITNYDLETDATGWNAYFDAGTAPVDATGGSPSPFSCTRVADTSLKGTGVLRLTHPAALYQGAGCSFDFTVDKGYRTRTVEVSFLYRVSSGTMTAGSDSTTGDLVVYAYNKGDVSGTTRVIQLTPYKTTCNSSSQCNFVGYFQLDAQDTQYRLALHWAGTGTSAVNVDFDEISVGPKNSAQGPPVSDATSYTPTLSNITATVNSSTWQRIGDRMRIVGTLTLTGAASGNIGISLPSGYSIDTSKVNSSTAQNLGVAYAVDATGNLYTGNALYGGTSTINFTGPNTASRWNATVPFTWASSDTLSYIVDVPIQGWGSNLAMSNDGDSRPTGALYQGTATGTLNSSQNLVTFPTKRSDSHAAYSSGTYTVPSAGYYDISATAEVNATYAAGGGASIFIKVNGTEISRGKATQVGSGAGYVLPTAIVKFYPLNAGDLVTVYVTTDGTSPSYGGTGGGFAISKVQGREATVPGDPLLALYTSSANQTFSNTTPVALVHGTKVYDTFNLYNSSTGVFTCNQAMKVRVSGAFFLTSATYVLGSRAYISLYKNGSQSKIMNAQYGIAAQTTPISLGGTATIDCVAGDTLQVYAGADANAATTLNGNAQGNWVSYEKAGNF
jgi:hypothetical protein